MIGSIVHGAPGRRLQCVVLCAAALVLSAASAVHAAPAATAAAPRSELANFLGVLRQRGYADFVADYLKLRKDDPGLPADIRETWDVEMANCLWISSTQTSNEQEAEKRRQAAQGHLETFLKEHPNHPAVADMMMTWGTSALERGRERVRLATVSAGEPEKEVHLKEGKTLLAEAHTRLTKSVEAFKTTVAEAKAAARGAAKQDEATADLLYRASEARFMLALTDYWIAQTCGADQAAEKTKRLKDADDVFQEIYKEYKESDSEAWRFPHYWRARIMSETQANNQNVLEDAVDMCDEVMTIATGTIPKNINPMILGLISDATVLHMQLLAKTDQLQVAIDEGATWIKANEKLHQNTAAFHQIVIEWVKLSEPELKKIDNAPKRAAALKSMNTLLTRIAKRRGPYQLEASKLLAQLNKQAGGKAQATTYEEALAAAESARIAEQWPTAIANYKQALDLLDKSKLSAAEKQKQDAEIRDLRAHAEFFVAQGLARDNQLGPAADAAEKIIADAPKSAAAPAAASLALQALQVLINAEKEPARQEPLEKRLQALATSTLKSWPNSPEADEARYVLGRDALKQKQGQQGIDLLTSVAPNSPRYSAAMLTLGHYAWRRYHEEMAKPEANRDAKVLEQTKEKALKWLTASVAAQKPPAADAKPDPEADRTRRQQQAELYLLLANVQTANNKNDDALASYQKVVDAGLGAPGQPVDPTTLRALRAALQGNIQRKEYKKAGEMAVELGKRAGDRPETNAVLFIVLRYLVYDAHEAEKEAVGAKDPAAAKERLVEARNRAKALLEVVSKQTQHPASALVYMGDACMRLGMEGEGKTIYLRIMTEASRQPAFAKEAGPAIVSVQSKLIGLLLKDRQYPQALQQVDALLAKYPTALDVLVKRGEVLQAWATEKDPARGDPARIDEAIQQWNGIRTKLMGLPPNEKPADYYTAVLNTARCLLAKSRRDNQPESVIQAEKLLNGTLDQDANLRSKDPATIKKFKLISNDFKKVINEAATQQGRPPTFEL